MCGATEIVNSDLYVQLTSALETYDKIYDEVFESVHERMAGNGFATKMDISALLFWKRIETKKFRMHLLETSDSKVRSVTQAAFADGMSNADRLDAMRPLPGCKSGIAVPTTILAAFDPGRFGIYDERALKALKRLRVPNCKCTISRGDIFFDHLARLATEMSVVGNSWTPRQVDMALFKLGKS